MCQWPGHTDQARAASAIAPTHMQQDTRQGSLAKLQLSLPRGQTSTGGSKNEGVFFLNESLHILRTMPTKIRKWIKKCICQCPGTPISSGIRA